jgi:WD40 repeat protein
MSSSGPTIILKTPGAVSALCFANTSFFASGAADGSIRFYDLPEIKVQKAVRRLGSEISSLAFSPRSAGVIWAAAGREVGFPVSENLVETLILTVDTLL